MGSIVLRKSCVVILLLSVTFIASVTCPDIDGQLYEYGSKKLDDMEDPERTSKFGPTVELPREGSEDRVLSTITRLSTRKAENSKYIVKLLHALNIKTSEIQPDGVWLEKPEEITILSIICGLYMNSPVCIQRTGFMNNMLDVAKGISLIFAYFGEACYKKMDNMDEREYFLKLGKDSLKNLLKVGFKDDEKVIDRLIEDANCLFEIFVSKERKKEDWDKLSSNLNTLIDGIRLDDDPLENYRNGVVNPMKTYRNCKKRMCVYLFDRINLGDDRGLDESKLPFVRIVITAFQILANLAEDVVKHGIVYVGNNGIMMNIHENVRRDLCIIFRRIFTSCSLGIQALEKKMHLEQETGEASFFCPIVKDNIRSKLADVLAIYPYTKDIAILLGIGDGVFDINSDGIMEDVKEFNSHLMNQCHVVFRIISKVFDAKIREHYVDDFISKTSKGGFREILLDSGMSEEDVKDMKKYVRSHIFEIFVNRGKSQDEWNRLEAYIKEFKNKEIAFNGRIYNIVQKVTKRRWGDTEEENMIRVKIIIDAFRLFAEVLLKVFESKDIYEGTGDKLTIKEKLMDEMKEIFTIISNSYGNYNKLGKKISSQVQNNLKSRVNDLFLGVKDKLDTVESQTKALFDDLGQDVGKFHKGVRRLERGSASLVSDTIIEKKKLLDFIAGLLKEIGDLKTWVLALEREVGASGGSRLSSRPEVTSAPVVNPSVAPLGVGAAGDNLSWQERRKQRQQQEQDLVEEEARRQESLRFAAENKSPLQYPGSGRDTNRFLGGRGGGQSQFYQRSQFPSQIGGAQQLQQPQSVQPQYGSGSSSPVSPSAPQLSSSNPTRCKVT